MLQIVGRSPDMSTKGLDKCDINTDIILNTNKCLQSHFNSMKHLSGYWEQFWHRSATSVVLRNH